MIDAARLDIEHEISVSIPRTIGGVWVHQEHLYDRLAINTRDAVMDYLVELSIREYNSESDYYIDVDMPIQTLDEAPTGAFFCCWHNLHFMISDGKTPEQIADIIVDEVLDFAYDYLNGMRKDERPGWSFYC